MSFRGRPFWLIETRLSTDFRQYFPTRPRMQTLQSDFWSPRNEISAGRNGPVKSPMIGGFDQVLAQSLFNAAGTLGARARVPGRVVP